MVNYLEILSVWMKQPHYLLVILIMLYLISGTIDFLIGTVNAGLTPTVEFSTRTAQLGIIRKLVTLSVMILVVPLALILPMDFGIYSLMILYLGIVVSEIYSILAHIGIVQETDKHKNLVGTLFIGLLDSILNNKSKAEIEKKEDND